MADFNIAFPRGGAQESKEGVAKSQSSKRHKKKDGSKQMTELEKSESSRTQFEGIWHNRMNTSLLINGVLGLGVIREIRDGSIEIDSADGVTVTLPATNISDRLTATLKSCSLELADVFAIGQMIAFKVVKAANSIEVKKKGEIRRAVVSCDPSVVNAHVVPSALVDGLVLNGAIESVEDKGAVVSLGLRSSELRGFLPSTALPEHLNLETLIPGQILLLRIQNFSSSGQVGRVINVSAVPEMDNVDVRVWEKLNLNMLMPGTILPVKPLHSTSKGVYVELSSDVKGFIRKQHLPPHLRNEPCKIMRTIRVVVMFCQQNSQILVLCAHPDIVALSKPHKRSTFEGISIGDNILCQVSDVDKYGNVYFDVLIDGSSKSSLVSAFATKASLQTSNEENIYKRGSTHQARVLSYRMIERQLIVSTKKEVFAQKMVSLVDAIPGEKVRARILSIKPSGLLVRVYDRIFGFIPIVHVSDKHFTRIDKRFKKGQMLDCRILEADSLRHRLILTSKPSLLDTKYVIIRKYCECDVGAITLGYIRSEHPSGGLVIGFYGGVRAFMFPKDAARLGDVKTGCTVQVKVQSVDVEKERMLVVVADPSLIADTIVIRSNAFKQSSDAPLCYAATIAGISNVGGDMRNNQRLDLDVHLGKQLGGTVRTSMAVHLLSDTLDPLVDTLKDCFRIGAKIPKVTILGEDGIIKVTSKRFVIDWLERHPRITCFEDLSKGLLACGTVTQRHKEMGYFVELAGGSALVAPARFVCDSSCEDGVNEELQIGQTVIVRVASLDFERKRFSLVLDPSLCNESIGEGEWCSMGMRLLEYTMADWEWCMLNLQTNRHLPPLGSRISVTIVQPLNDAIIIEWSEYGLKGCATKGNFPERQYTKEETVTALLLDVSLPSCKLEVYIIDDSDKTASQSKKVKKASTKLKRVAMESEVKVCVAVVKRDFIAAVTIEDDFEKSVIYLPSRFHPNIVTRPPSMGRFVCGAVFKATVKRVFGSTLIGVAEGDSALAAALLTAKTKAKKEKSSVESHRIKVKPFMIYPAKIVGAWNRGEKSACAVELELPGGTLGRLHGSELNESLLENGKCPVKAFLHEKSGKTVNVKVISMGTITEATSKKSDLSKATKKKPVEGDKNVISCVRVAECTMRSWKMVEGKKKQSLLAYQQKYVQGELVTVFVKKPLVGGTLQVEASPICGGFIQKQNLGETNLVMNPTDAKWALTDAVFEPGEVLKARVVGIMTAKKRSRGCGQRKSLELTLIENKKEIKPDERVLGRVISRTHSPSSVVFALVNGQRAVITPVGVTSRYTHALEDLQAFQLNEVYFIYVIRFDEEAGKWLAVSESRYESWRSKNKKHTGSELIRHAADVEENSLLKGFVSSTSMGQVYVEVGLGVMGRIEQRKSTMTLKPDQLITVRVLRIFPDGGLRLLYMGSIATDNADEKAPALEKPEGRKRIITTTSSDSEVGMMSARKKSRMAGFNGPERSSVDMEPVKVKVNDPGLDWSLSGFTPADFAAVARIGEDKEKIGDEDWSKEGTSRKVKLSEGAEKTEKEHIEVDEKRIKSKTKIEREIAKEKELSEREKELIEKSAMIGSQLDFDRLLAGNPNSSQLWIRYISFFVSEKDIEKARAVAERALNVINFREEDEIFNVWTAYLNLELSFGTPESLKAIFKRAISNSDALKMYKQMVRIYQNVHKNEEADVLLEEMLKKFRHEDLDVWFIYGQHLMQTKRFDEARELLKRATTSLDKKHHVTVINRFAQMEYKFGDSEQGKTLFESILNAYPRKADVWSVYIDMLIKSNEINEARQVFERVMSVNFGTHKMRTFFKKWIDMEQKYGTEEQQKLVRERAVHFIEDIAEKMDL